MTFAEAFDTERHTRRAKLLAFRRLNRLGDDSRRCEYRPLLRIRRYHDSEAAETEYNGQLAIALRLDDAHDSAEAELAGIWHTLSLQLDPRHGIVSGMLAAFNPTVQL